MVARYLLWPRERRQGYELDPPSHLQFWLWMAVVFVVSQAVMWILNRAGVLQTKLAFEVANGVVIALIALTAPIVLRKR